MWKKLIAMTSLVFTFAVAAVASSAAPAAAAPTSPGACNMLQANSRGLAGMDGSGLGPGQGQGLGNMMDLVFTSLAGGCSL